MARIGTRRFNDINCVLWSIKLTIAEALRTVTKWLNEDTSKIPKEEIAILCHAVRTARDILGIKE